MAFYSLQNKSNPILQVQRILRNLAQRDSEISLKPSGIYESDTQDAVKRFQRKYGLFESGVVDKETWDLLHLVEKARLDGLKIANGVVLFPSQEGYSIPLGTRDDLLFALQYMLAEIQNDHDDFEKITINGIYDEPTMNAVKSLQRKSLAEANGVLNSSAYNLIIREFERVNSIKF